MLLLLKAWSIISKYWRVILIALILSTTFYYKTRYNATVQAFEEYKANVATIEAKNKTINDEKLRVAKTIATNNEKSYQLAIQQRELNSVKLRKELEREKSNITNMLNDAYKLRVNSANSGGVSEVSTSPEVSTTGGSNATITLIRGGQSCAIDYKELMQSWLDNCAIYGCE